MALIAAFLWTKSPRSAISTLIFDNEKMQILSQSKISYLPKSYLAFRQAAKEIIKNFFIDIENFHQVDKKSVILEFKIVFNVTDIPYFYSARKSKFVLKVFHNACKKIQEKIKMIKIQPQLRQRLSGKSLKRFKQELRSLHLVSRKKDRGFEYHLWSVALHATPATYAKKIQRVRTILRNAIWRGEL